MFHVFQEHKKKKKSKKGKEEEARGIYSLLEVLQEYEEEWYEEESQHTAPAHGAIHGFCMFLSCTYVGLHLVVAFRSRRRRRRKRRRAAMTSGGRACHVKLPSKPIHSLSHHAKSISKHM